MIKKLEDVLQPDPNMAILTLKEKINEMIEMLNDHEQRVGSGA